MQNRRWSSKAGGCACDDATDADPAKLKTLAKEMSYTSAGVALALGVEHGAVVRYILFDRGARVDEYLSVPEYFGELPPGDVYRARRQPDGRRAPDERRAGSRTGGCAHRGDALELPPAQELYEQLASVFGVQP